MHWLTLILDTLAHIGGMAALTFIIIIAWKHNNMSEKLKKLLGIKAAEGMFKILTYRLGTVTADIPLEHTGKDAHEAITHAMNHENAKPGDVFYATEGDQIVAMGIIDWFNVKHAHILEKEPINPEKMSSASLSLLMQNDNLRTKN